MYRKHRNRSKVSLTPSPIFSSRAYGPQASLPPLLQPNSNTHNHLQNENNTGNHSSNLTSSFDSSHLSPFSLPVPHNGVTPSRQHVCLFQFSQREPNVPVGVNEDDLLSILHPPLFTRGAPLGMYRTLSPPLPS